jgi:hypothetical protein
MKHNPLSRVNRKKAKTVLRLPDLEFAKTAVLSSLTSLDEQRGYRHAIDEFVDWYCSEPRLAFNRIVVLRYWTYLETRQLASGTINLRLGAVRRLAYESADLWPSQFRPRGRYPPGQRRQETGRAPWELADCRTKSRILVGARQSAHERKAGPSPSRLAPGMWSKTA